jgi:predicted naringenin-chalcone synthase
MADRSGIAHRYSSLAAGDINAGEVDAGGVYQRGAFPSTGTRMALYGPQALALAARAVRALDVSAELDGITHLIVASCTGFTAPGLDLQLAEQLGLRTDVERTIVGFMGCSAAVPALRLAHHTVRSSPDARVLVVNCELCTLHLQETSKLETVLSFLLFGDGASAALVTAEPTGLALEDFRAAVISHTQDLITWQIGDQGFDMRLSGEVPAKIAQALSAERANKGDNGILRGLAVQEFALWGVHGGGRTVLDAVEAGLALGPDALRYSQQVLHDYGNMSSATVMFVLQRMLQDPHARGADGTARGLAMAFGPGMSAETFRFRLI